MSVQHREADEGAYHAGYEEMEMVVEEGAENFQSVEQLRDGDAAVQSAVGGHRTHHMRRQVRNVRLRGA